MGTQTTEAPKVPFLHPEPCAYMLACEVAIVVGLAVLLGVFTTRRRRGGH